MFLQKYLLVLEDNCCILLHLAEFFSTLFLCILLLVPSYFSFATDFMSFLLFSHTFITPYFQGANILEEDMDM